MKTVPVKITLGVLHEHRACETQCVVFSEHWPKGARITPCFLRKAAEVLLNLNWAAMKFLPNKEWLQYKQALDTHECFESKPGREALRMWCWGGITHGLSPDARALVKSYCTHCAEALIKVLFEEETENG